MAEELAFSQYWSGGRGTLCAGRNNTRYRDYETHQMYSWGNGFDAGSPDPVGNIDFVTAHFDEGMYITRDYGEVITFGRNNNFRRFNEVNRCDPRQEVVPGRPMYRPLCYANQRVSNAVGGACGFDFGLVVLTDGRVMGYGSNRKGQLGPKDVGSNNVEPHFISGLWDVKSVAAGMDFSVVLMRDGTVRTCGANKYGQLGYETSLYLDEFDANRYHAEVEDLENIVCITCGYYNTLALTSDGEVFTWGNNLLGRGIDTEEQTYPIKLNGIYNAIDIACGRDHAVILRADGTIVSFAAAVPKGKVNIHRLLGVFRPGTDLALPEKVPGINNAVGVACGDDHTTVIIEEESLNRVEERVKTFFFIFGDNSHKQFGQNTPPEVEGAIIELGRGQLRPVPPWRD
jgi:alpha-tubulin suppressor-like RCC1 family protein